ncbi:CHD3-type chromatin-remodeling factor PICKLE [Glycine soja]|uniref:CHD3-type chromatin-remodeling factor PICKLE n=1 Tax=Glycine soja TaxID=3848 RepID=A0A0B2SQ32_GLYSO|nr:CHD3-type chromatin-remodeling factor PICKLE [Glycine soja]
MISMEAKLFLMVANFEYVEEVEPSEEVTQNRAKENQSSVTSSKRTNYWEELLKNAYEENKVEELNALGKGKRNRNKWLGGGFSGLEDVSSDDEDDSYKEDLTDDDSNSTETTTTRRPHKKKARDSMGPLPLMEGEGRSLKVLGFTQNQRAAFVQILMRFGVGDFDWKEFTSRMKQKSYEEIMEYGKLFLSHIAEDITDSPTFTGLKPKGLGLLLQPHSQHNKNYNNEK